MKKVVVLLGFFCFFAFLNYVYASGDVKTFTGKVTAIDPKGAAIVVSERVGKSEMVVGVIVTPETVIKIGNKKGELKDLKLGDRVTISYERTTDLYAKTIVKK